MVLKGKLQFCEYFECCSWHVGGDGIIRKKFCFGQSTLLTVAIAASLNKVCKRVASICSRKFNRMFVKKKCCQHLQLRILMRFVRKLPVVAVKSLDKVCKKVTSICSREFR